MPRILAINCNSDTIALFRADPRCTVQAARHGSDESHNKSLGSPADYGIIVFGCGDGSEDPATAPAVGDDFVREAVRLGAVSVETVAPDSSHIHLPAADAHAAFSPAARLLGTEARAVG